MSLTTKNPTVWKRKRPPYRPASRRPSPPRPPIDPNAPLDWPAKRSPSNDRA